MDCDILIQNARILDGTGSKAFNAEVAIKDGRILALGDFGRMANPA